MDKVRYSSFKFKVYEDKMFKLEKQRQIVHLDDIILQHGSKKNLDEIGSMSSKTLSRGMSGFSDYFGNVAGVNEEAKQNKFRVSFNPS